MNLLKFTHNQDDSDDSREDHRKDSPCILAVDDHEDSLVLITQFLDFLGFVNVSASDAQQAYILAQKYQPDLIFLDIVLPDISGIELHSHLRRNQLTKNITVVALTALALTEEREQIIQAGFDDYLVKPYRLEELETLLKLHLQGKFPKIVPHHHCQQQEA